MAKEQVIKTACNLCVARCGLDVHLSEGKVVKVTGMRDHPVSQGHICPKGATLLDYVNSPDRLKYPLKKEKGNWKRISWDEALDILANQLTRVKTTYGAKSLAVFAGMQFLIDLYPGRGLLQRFLDVYGSPNFFNVDSMCYRPRLMSYHLTFGEFMLADMANAKLIVLWACNPDNSDPPTARIVRQAQEKGAKLIVIDPRRIRLAKEADIHIQPRPGTDCALALGMLNVIISEGLYDKEFINKWTVGFEELVERVKSYTPQKVAEITWVPADQIREIARLFGTIKPACIYQGTNGLDQTTSGFQSGRSIAILHAVTGNVDLPGGFIPSWNAADLIKPHRFTEMLSDKPLWQDAYPLVYDVWGRLGDGQGMELPDAILTGKPYPIKAMIVSACNPALSLPNSKKIVEALSKLDFLAVMTVFMSETANLADLVLPAATLLEKTDFVPLGRPYPLHYAFLRKKVMEFEEAWPDAKFWLRLAQKMGYGQYFPWEEPDEFLDYLLEPSGLSVELLTKEKPAGLIYQPLEYGVYIKGAGFSTPTGKVEIYSKTMKDLGYDPLPLYYEPVESPTSTPEIAREYPLVLTTGARMLEFLHSRMRNIPKLRKMAPEPFAEINPQTAKGYDIKDGEVIAISTKRGTINVKARVTDDIMPQVVHLPHGWAEANANTLTFARPADPVSGIPTMKALLCKVGKIG